MSAAVSDPSPASVRDRPVLTISLAAVAHNYQVLKDAAPGAETSAVVKANGYGLGAIPIARKVHALGCRTFFVATLGEGQSLRAALGSGPRIFILNGLPPGASLAFAAHDLTPVLNTLDEAREWAAFAKRPCAIHIDTGMARAGMSPIELDALVADRALLAQLDLVLIMSHLACADEPDHPQNVRQLSRFKAVLARLPSAPASFSSSGGIFLRPEYHFDLTRPGLALYGGRPHAGGPNPMRAVAVLTADVIGLRTIERGETVGYGATFAASRETRLAVCNIGYADGLRRALSNRGVAHVEGIACPYVGRVSMDLLTIDVTAVPSSQIGRGTMVEIIGPHSTIEDMAERAGTASYEILTSLGPRFTRVIVDGMAGRFG